MTIKLAWVVHRLSAVCFPKGGKVGIAAEGIQSPTTSNNLLKYARTNCKGYEYWLLSRLSDGPMRYK